MKGGDAGVERCEPPGSFCGAYTQVIYSFCVLEFLVKGRKR